MYFRRGRADRPRGWWTVLAITLATALFAHLAFDVIAGGWAALLNPLHLVYGAAVLIAAGFAARDLAARDASERRRRGALMRARLHDMPRPFVATVLAQIALAGLMFALEPQADDPLRLGVAAVAALLALVAGAFVTRRVEAAVLRFATAAFARRKPRSFQVFALAVRAFVAGGADDAYNLFRPNRPPPTFA